MAPSRRQVIKAGIVTGATATVGGPLLLSSRDAAKAATIDPTTIPQYVTQLPVLQAMPPISSSSGKLTFSIGAKQITQQMLPSGFPATPSFGYGSTASSGSYHGPGYTIESQPNLRTQVTWVNQHVDSSGNYQSPLVTVDPTLHWANPPGGTEGRDSMPTFTSTPAPYTGPIPMITHLHGGHTFEESDGYPEAWYLPAAKNIPAGYATTGSFYDQFAQEAQQRWGTAWSPGSAVFTYPFDQLPGTLWYHDHSLGMTRTNVYPGLVGFVILRGGPNDLPAGVLPGPAPQPGDAAGKKYYEYMMVLGDKSFNTDGTLFFPASRSDFGDTTGPYIPQTDVPPYWNPTFLGTTITVNGAVWPNLNVEPRRYRFRWLAAANIRPWALKVVSDPLATRPASAALPIWVIGNDGGFLPGAAVSVDSLPIVTAERYDTIIDFTGIAPGTKLYLINEGGASTVGTTGQVMQFTVGQLASTDTSTPPAQLTLPGFSVPAPTNTRQLAFTQITSAQLGSGVIAQMAVGTVNSDGTANPIDWSAPITENPALNSTETWELWNFGPGGHAFHLHLVEGQIINRQPIAGGATTPPNPWETGPKDVVSIPANQITRFKATFDRASRYVWHCHFLDHEDHDMMRPWLIS